MYQWLKAVILSCEFVVPGTNVRDLRNDTIFMIRKMIDPTTVCTNDTKETAEIMRRANVIARQFDNTASAIMTNWDIWCMKEGIYEPVVLAARTAENPSEGFNPFPDLPAPLSTDEIAKRKIPFRPYKIVICQKHESGSNV